MYIIVKYALYILRLYTSASKSHIKDHEFGSKLSYMICLKMSMSKVMDPYDIF